MIPNIPSLSPLFEFVLPRNISGMDFGTGYGGTVCGFHTRPYFRSVKHTDKMADDGSGNVGAQINFDILDKVEHPYNFNPYLIIQLLCQFFSHSVAMIYLL